MAFNAPVTQSPIINITGAERVSLCISVPPPGSSSPTPHSSRTPSPKLNEQGSLVPPVEETEGGPPTTSPLDTLSSALSAPEGFGDPFFRPVEESEGQHFTVISHTVDPPLQPRTADNGAPAHCDGSPTGSTPRELSSSTTVQSPPGVGLRQRWLQQPSKFQESETDRLYEFGVGLFNTWPYRLHQMCYRRSAKDVIRLLFAVFIAYQVVACVLLSICERGGFRLIFQDLEKTNSEILHRLVMFALRLLIRVVTPICLFQPSVPAVVPSIPRTGLSEEQAKDLLVKVHKQFSPLHEFHEVKGSSVAKVFSITECIMKRQITSAWVIIVHSVLFTALLYYLGVFLLIKDKLVMKGVCNLSYINETTIHLPLLSISMHLLVALELVSVFVLVLIIGLTKEFYCYENKIAVYTIVALDTDTNNLCREIRKRWRVVDCYCYSMPLCLLSLLGASVYTGKVFTPSPSQDISADDIANWYFWITVLLVLTFLSTSPNRMIKHGCLIGYLTVAVLVVVMDAEGLAIPVAGSSIMILMFITLAAINFNLLFSLWRCHFHHWCERRDRLSYNLMLYCLACLVLLPLLVTVTVCREVVSFSEFLHICYNYF